MPCKNGGLDICHGKEAGRGHCCRSHLQSRRLSSNAETLEARDILADQLFQRSRCSHTTFSCKLVFLKQVLLGGTCCSGCLSPWKPELEGLLLSISALTLFKLTC